MSQATEFLIDTRIVSLNSKDADKNNGALLSNVNFRFPEILREEADILFTTVSLYSAEIPCSFYNININNNVLQYTVESVQYSLTIPEGNYNSTTFSAAFKTQFEAETHAKTITLAIDRLTGLLTFSISAFTLAFLYTNSSMYEVLGFDDETNYSFSDSLTAPHMANLLGVKKIKILSNALAHGGIDSASMSGSSLLHTLSVDKAAFQLLTYQNPSSHFAKLKRKTISEIDIQLRDENNDLLDMNNIYWDLSILLNIYRKFQVSPIDNVIHLEALEFHPTEPLSRKEIKRIEEEVRDEALDELNLLLS